MAAKLSATINQNGENRNWVASVARQGFGMVEELQGACAQPFQALVGAVAWRSELSP
jgi:hypothetical protein